MTSVRCYSDLVQLVTFKDRFDYLSLGGRVGLATFGHDRWLNQRFYRSDPWKRVRDQVIIRDGGCDLGVISREIQAGLLVHHMNPMDSEAIEHGDPDILDPEYLITTCALTHNAIHY